MSTLRLLSLEIRFEQDVVLVRQRARELAAALGFERQLQTSIATALSEVARNAYQYAKGGRVEFSVVTENMTGLRLKTRQTFVVVVQDRGPGIANLEEIFSGRYQSQTGMGLGITGTRRLMDRAEFESSPNGTKVTLEKVLPDAAPQRSPAALQAIVDELGHRPPSGPLEEVQQQNQDLIRLMDETRAREDELTRLNNELTETNTGVLALYDELETLHRISTTLASKLELKPLIQTIVEVTTSLTNAFLGTFYFCDEKTGRWSLFTSSPDSRLSANSSVDWPPDFLGDLKETGIVHRRRLQAHGELGFVESLRGIMDVRSFLAVPVIDAQGVMLGALAFSSTKDDGFSERSERILTSVAAQAVVGIEKARLFQSVTAASDAKDQFLAMVSHELRTPLNPVLAIISGLHGDSRVPADVAEELAVVWRNVRLEARLIDDLLDFNRLIKGKIEILREPMDMHELIQSVIDICREELTAKDQHLLTDFRAEKAVVMGDSPRLQQVLWNVLRNANKFTPAGGRIAIHTAVTGDRLQVTVVDNGQGIEPTAMDTIFGAFSQGRNHGHFGGLGLGLAIARMFVELHDGTVVGASEGLGKGARFTIELPLADVPVAKVQKHFPVRVESNPTTGRILLVDDHPDTLQSLSRLLQRRGYTVVTAASGGAAREVLKEGASFDLLISDLGLPDCSGLELLAEIRAADLYFPAIALSGYGMEADLRHSQEAGFQAHLTKPVDFAGLAELIGTVLQTPKPG